jgi:hypothetical protein
MNSGIHLETIYSVADLESSDPLKRSAAYQQFLKPSGVSDAWRIPYFAAKTALNPSSLRSPALFHLFVRST